MVAKYKKAAKEVKIGSQHFIVLLIMIVSFFLLFQFVVIPAGMSAFVRSLFAPYGEQLEKIGYVEFKDGVYASIPKDRENQSYKGTEISNEIINKEYIFDFTFNERVSAKHGYAKGANEFYAKCPKLGEMAIIIEPWVALWLLALVFSVAVTLLVSIVMPTNIGYCAALFYNQIEGTKIKLRLQTGLTDEIIELLVMPDEQLRSRDIADVRSIFRIVWEKTTTEDLSETFTAIKFEDVFEPESDIVHFRNVILYKRIKEFYSEFVLTEIEDTKGGILWSQNHLRILKGVRLYMTHHFSEKYQNLVTGLAYGGAGFLIVAVGIRGLKFIPGDKPSFILLAIALEFSMLMLMAITLIYTEGEERMDKIMKKMEDANRSSLEAQRGQQADIHMLTNALVGQTSEIIKNRVEKAIEEYMLSDNEIERKIGEAIADKVLIGLKDIGDNKKQ